MEIEHDAYFVKHVIPWLSGHLTMRSTGLQIFSAIQGGLLIGWSTKHHWSIPVLGLISCLSFYLWDLRIRAVLRGLVQLGDLLIDQPRFGKAEDGHASNGLYAFICRHGGNPSLRKHIYREGSHTWAINIILLGASLLWIFLLATNT